MHGKFAVLAALVTASSPAIAGGYFETGNSLLRLCTSATATEQSECLGYIVAVADVLRANGVFISDIQHKHNDIVCIPSGVEAGQLADVVIKSLQQNPEMRQNPANIVVGGAIAMAFHCDPKRFGG